MKRIILIVTIALLPVLSICFVSGWPTYLGQAKTNLVLEVSKNGTLTNLKDDKGKRKFSKPIQEGIYIRYRVGDGYEQLFYAIGDRVSDPKASYSGYQEKLVGAGITTQDGLNVTSGFVHDKSSGTIRAIRTIVNRSNATMYLSEVKSYSDTNLPSLRTVIGAAKKVGPLQAGIGATAVPNIVNDNCWPCLPWPDCDLGTLVMDPTKTTVVCLSCGKAAEGFVHIICTANLDEELVAYKEKGCDYPIIITGIDGSNGRSILGKPCPTVSPTVGISTSMEVMPKAGQDLSEDALKQLLTLPAGAAIVVTTEYKIKKK